MNAGGASPGGRAARGCMSVLLHLAGPHQAAARLAAARQVAERFDAHVTALYAVTPALWRYPFALSSGAAGVEALQQIEHDQRAALRQVFQQAADGWPQLEWADDSTGDPLWMVSHRAMLADLLILGLPDPAAAADPLPADFVTSAIVASGRPTLLLPNGDAVPPFGRRLLVAWKETREAARALAAALPWMASAEQVHVVSWQDDDVDARGDAEAGGGLPALARHLARHGITATMHRRAGSPRDITAGLAEVIAGTGADLLVMGCYGHARAREWMLGGSTRSVLHGAGLPVPVLMSH